MKIRSLAHLLKIAVSAALLALCVPVIADELDQSNFSVTQETTAAKAGGYAIKIRIKSPLALQRTGVRASSDNWKSKKDYLMKPIGNGEFETTIGPFPAGANIEFAVFGEDAVAERWLWDNYFRQNHKIALPSSGTPGPSEGKSPSHSAPDFVADIEARKNNEGLDARFSRAATEYLRKHKLYLSLTTSPKRIANLMRVIDTIDLSKMEKIYVNIPEKFGRDSSTYTVPAELSNNPKVVINRIDKDLGPITKILPAAQAIQKTDPDAWIISIDDDIKYNKFLIRDLVNAKAAHPDAVISGSGQLADFWGISAPEFPGHAENYSTNMKSTGLAPVDVVEGFAGIIYRAGDLEVDKIREQSALSRETFVSDDVVLSFALGQKRIPKLRLTSRRYGASTIEPYDYGLRGDALHFGAGLTSEPTTIDINAPKYLRAFRVLLHHSLGEPVPCDLKSILEIIKDQGAR